MGDVVERVPELPSGAKIAAPDLGAPVDGSAIPALPPKRTYHGHDAYCHVCWEAVYVLWADPEPPDYNACPLGPYTAQTCPNAVAGSRRVKVSLEVEKRALELWREREAGFPQRVRRMNPDSLDRASGAWEIIRNQAVREVLFGKRPDQSVGRESDDAAPERTTGPWERHLMIADYEIRTSAGALLRTTPDRAIARACAKELAEQFDSVTVHRVIRIERREIIAEFLSERAKRAVA